MSKLTYAQVKKLLATVNKTVPDKLNCDDCFELVAEMAESQIRGDELSETLKAVQIHFSQCPCCAYEYAALLEAIHAADELP